MSIEKTRAVTVSGSNDGAAPAAPVFQQLPAEPPTTADENVNAASQPLPPINQPITTEPPIFEFRKVVRAPAAAIWRWCTSSDRIYRWTENSVVWYSKDVNGQYDVPGAERTVVRRGVFGDIAVVERVLPESRKPFQHVYEAVIPEGTNVGGLKKLFGVILLAEQIVDGRVETLIEWRTWIHCAYWGMWTLVSLAIRPQVIRSQLRMTQLAEQECGTFTGVSAMTVTAVRLPPAPPIQVWRTINASSPLAPASLQLLQQQKTIEGARSATAPAAVSTPAAVPTVVYVTTQTETPATAVQIQTAAPKKSTWFNNFFR